MQRIDTKFCRDEFDSCTVIKHDGKYTLVEVGSTLSVPPIIEHLKKNNIHLEDVKNVLLTHVHLDHAGGAGLLL